MSSKIPYDPDLAPLEGRILYPSTLPSCNSLFQEYVLNYGTVMEVQSVGDGTYDEEELRRKYSKPFFLKILVLLPDRYTTWQRVYVRLYMNWTGLNGTGMDFLYLTGLCCSRTAFVEKRKEIVDQEMKEMKVIVESSYPKVYFMDNFNVAYYIRAQKETGSQVSDIYVCYRVWLAY